MSRAAQGPAPPTRSRTVDWSAYADGEVHELVRGVDHDQPVLRARLTLNTWCHRHGLRAWTRLHGPERWTVRITRRSPIG